MRKRIFAVVPAALLALLLASAASATSMTDTRLILKIGDLLESEGIELVLGQKASLDPQTGDVLLEISAIDGALISHENNTIAFEKDGTRVALEDFVINTETLMVNSLVGWLVDGEAQLLEFDVPVFNLFPRPDGGFEVVLKQAAADVLNEAFETDVFNTRDDIGILTTAAVPEPSTAALLGLGVAGLWAAGRRRIRA